MNAQQNTQQDERAGTKKHQQHRDTRREHNHPWYIFVPKAPEQLGFQPPIPTLQHLQQVGLRYGTAHFPGDGYSLLVVVSCPAHLSKARIESESGRQVVVWAWLCSEVLARQAESEFAVVYGIPTAAEVMEAYEEGPREQEITSMCLKIESAFNIPESFSVA